ncbi:FHA domain-containing protein [Corynebacterium sp. ES2730-CONJ]|uniref:FHA domain-containing protein FhaB/FipA n=1 Tax=Corynebacterium sp. ES2730-CONJ TaxID=2973941 RepID=UPI00216AD222|nr:FHA domain-containing protein [Corynebacterium sp. ES2730-CONJ]MCS4532319.1 FHA domain-containing protein [Corynebacterium sp. ES2730-CONJ]
MDSAFLFGLRIGLLALLWLFIFFAFIAMRRTMKSHTSPAVAQAPLGGRPQQLAILDGPLTGYRVDLSGLSDITIGRSHDCGLNLDDDFTSGHHARLFSRGNEWFIEDLDSRNGTFVQGARIDAPERVVAGQDLKIGRTTLRLVG